MAELNGVPAKLDHLKALALVNYGHYTTMRVHDLRVRGLSLHLERLVHDCRRVFDADLDPDRIRGLVRHALIEAPRSIVVRVTVFDPGLELGRPGADAQPHLLITIRAAAPTPLPPLRLQATQYRREMPAVKHVGLFGSLSRRRSAQRNGFDDVLFTGAGATISEAATANIGLLIGDEIIWPRADCLAGVTMNLITAVRHPNTSTVPVTLSQLADVDAVFATNATAGIRSVWPSTILSSRPSIPDSRSCASNTPISPSSRCSPGNIAVARGVSSPVGPSGTLSPPTPSGSGSPHAPHQGTRRPRKKGHS